MKYNSRIIKICKPMYKMGIKFLTIGMILLAIGLAIALCINIWVTFFIGVFFVIVSVIMCNIPNVYLVSLIKAASNSMTSKQASKIVQTHLQQSEGVNTLLFVQDFIRNDIQQKAE
ncbi:hypothetical protein [Flavobacterium sp.]|uniref:hypothetical protein n=1 Tax=Flavobacterium sp. TaxID=239 RepID=UPI0037BA9336